MPSSTYDISQKVEVKYLPIESFVSNQSTSYSRIATKVRAADQVRFAT